MKNLIMITTAAASLAGCASAFNPIGDSKYDCHRKQNPDSFYCRSFAGVEASTHGELPETRYSKPFSIRKQDELQNMAPTGTDAAEPMRSVDGVRFVGNAGQPMSASAGSAPKSLAGQPVRMAPIVQRTWIKRHVTADDMLIENTVVYKERQPTRWAGFEHVAADTAAASRVLYPHKPLQKKETSAAIGAPDSDPHASKDNVKFAQPGIGAGQPGGEAAESPLAVPGDALRSLPR